MAGWLNQCFMYCLRSQKLKVTHNNRLHIHFKNHKNIKFNCNAVNSKISINTREESHLKCKFVEQLLSRHWFVLSPVNNHFKDKMVSMKSTILFFLMVGSFIG